MSENELFEHRIKTLENDVKILYGKVNTFAINQAEENTKLDNLLLSVGTALGYALIGFVN